ncbi:MAG: hypothetical protein C0592_07485, partial [Marinilabiliales bacterium]
TDLYFYHPDHLGSSAFITNASGNVCEHLQYLPFGEMFIYQNKNEHAVRYKFSAKELDPETNYTYFGARYYDSDLSVWLSVDPMSDKHADYTPYAYCFNNPITYIDPFGLDTVLFNSSGEFQTPLPGGDDNTDTYIRVKDEEFENNKIDYKKNGKLRGRHKNKQIDKSFRESMERNGASHIYQAGDYDESKGIFEFFAKNTKVEWAHIIYQEPTSGDTKCEVSTDHDPGFVFFNIPMDREKDGYKLVDVRHSHVDDFISHADRNSYTRYNNKWPVKAYMLKYGKYYPYIGVRTKKERYAVDPQSY